MKIATLILSILFSINIGYSQSDLVLPQDSIVKIKKQERKKANEFIIKTVGKETFYSYFKPERVEFFKKADSIKLNCTYNCFFVFLKYIGKSRSYVDIEDRSFLISNASDFNYSIISYNLNIRGFSTEESSRIYIIHDVNKDSCYFYQPEIIPPFILKRDTNNFITNEQLLKIIQQKYSKRATWKKLAWKSNTKICYFPKRNIYIFDVEIRIKTSKILNYIKYKRLVVNAYTGEVLGIKKYKRPRLVQVGLLYPDNEESID